jgi:dynein heavy chain
MFFGLVYFHAILSGRRKYGTVGWNVPYVFDLSDFEVSNAQLSYMMKSPKVHANESKARR